MKNEQEVRKTIGDYESLKEELEDLVYNVLSIAKKYNFSEGSMDSFELTEDNININWSYSWQYGGYNSGMDSYPIKLLWENPEQYFLDLFNKKIKEDVKLLKELKKKYEK